MFFRRPTPAPATFAGCLDGLRRAGFQVMPRAGGLVEVERAGCAVALRPADTGTELAGRAGVRMGEEIAVLVDGGFQKFFRAPSGRTKPALASDLRALHAFEEDLKEVLGLESLYNQALGTVSTYYQYDRLRGREP